MTGTRAGQGGGGRRGGEETNQNTHARWVEGPTGDEAARRVALVVGRQARRHHSAVGPHPSAHSEGPKPTEPTGATKQAVATTETTTQGAGGIVGCRRIGHTNSGPRGTGAPEVSLAHQRAPRGPAVARGAGGRGGGGERCGKHVTEEGHPGEDPTQAGRRPGALFEHGAGARAGAEGLEGGAA